MTEQELRALCEDAGVTPRLYRRQRGQRTGEYWHLTTRATTNRRGGTVDVYLSSAAKLPALSEADVLDRIAHLKRKAAAARPPAPEEHEPAPDGSEE